MRMCFQTLSGRLSSYWNAFLFSDLDPRGGSYTNTSACSSTLSWRNEPRSRSSDSWRGCWASYNPDYTVEERTSYPSVNASSIKVRGPAKLEIVLTSTYIKGPFKAHLYCSESDIAFNLLHCNKPQHNVFRLSTPSTCFDVHNIWYGISGKP